MQDRAKEFIDEVIALSRKHGLAISHEDGHGCFIIEPVDEYLLNWLKDARIGSALTKEPRDSFESAKLTTGEFNEP